MTDPQLDTAEALAREAMTRYSLLVHASTSQLVTVVDAAHGAGLSIPPAVGPALQVLGALAEAWAANGNGTPAPADAKALLGLTPPHAPAGVVPAGLALGHALAGLPDPD